MRKITATFRIVTPMFIAGADQQCAELRAPSFKGALRWWYRALYPQADPHEEFHIFGGTDKNEGQACFLLRLPKRGQQLLDGAIKDRRWEFSKVAYLGYGVIDRRPTGNTKSNGDPEKKPMTIRPYLREGSRFSLEILFKPRRADVSEEDYRARCHKVKKALWALIMMGGLGARSRKGFGSLVVEKIEGMSSLPTLLPEDREALQSALQEFLAEFDFTQVGQCPEHTCFSVSSRSVVTRSQGGPMEALEWLGDTIHKYRSYQSPDRMACVTDDHHIMREWIKTGKKPSSIPKRAAFGLPHNYFFTSLGGKKGDINLMDDAKKGRRAAPLLFHIHEFPSSMACVVATFLPARLIPEDKMVTFTSNNHHEIEELPLLNDFSAVTELLGKIAEESGTEVWSHA